MIEALTEALAHYERGWSVLPVLRSKEPNRPLIRATRGTARWRCFQDRRADPEEIRRWFDLDPETGIGVVCGQVSGGLAVLDLDQPEQPVPLPPTATVRTARGRHHYFHAGDIGSRSFDWGDLQAEGRYCVAPVSRHAAGRLYEWELSPEVAGIAELPLSDSSRARDLESSEAPETYIRTTGLKADRASYLHGCTTWEDLDSGEVELRRVGAVLGFPDVPIGRAFSCVLHPDRNPSAALHRAESGTILYHDLHASRHGGRPWLPLARVRAALAGREAASGPELAVWRLRLAVEAGLVEPAALDGPSELPSEASDFVRPVWEGFRFLIACRWRREPGSPAPFTRRFASAWCSVPESQARAGQEELQRLGLLRPAGRDPRGTALWLPRGVVPIA